MTSGRSLGIVLLAALCGAVAAPAHAAPPFAGTIFISRDIITPADPSALTGLTYTGTGPRSMFDRRVDRFVTYTAFLFAATYADNRTIEVQVNPEFGTVAAAQAAAQRYAHAAGQLPAALRADVRTMWIHLGIHPFGGGNNNLLIHTGQGDQYIADGILEETLAHEAAHTSLDAAHANASGWRAAQAADGEYISTYARDNPTREDIAESFLPYLAARYRRDRLPASLTRTIDTTIPNRMAYFDAQGFDLVPFVQPAPSLQPPTLVSASASGTTVTIAWTAPASGTVDRYLLEVGTASGQANLATLPLDAAATSITANAPAGTFFIRMRSVRAGATSAPSNELSFVVPGGGCQPPAAPQQFAAAVNGRQVTFSWQHAGAPAFELEAGTAAGASNLIVLSLDGSLRTFTATAPPGQYYLRLRARSGCASAPSNEVAITVF